MVRSVIPSGPTAQEQLLARYVVGSPFRADPAPRPDTSTAVTCAVEGCARRYLTTEFLARHVAHDHDGKRARRARRVTALT